MAEGAFEFCDDLGPANILHVYDAKSGLKGTVVVDNVAAGPSIGGVRMAADVSTEECFRLARAMTLKNAAAGLPHGGGKSVIYGDPKMSSAEKEVLIRAFARAIEGIHGYVPGPDMGTDETCMAWIHDEIGRSVGLPREIGGIPLDEIGATGFGLAVAASVAVEFCDMTLEGARVAVQGFGAVGYHAARFLEEQGAVLVAAADSGGTISNPGGLDPELLQSLKLAGRSVTESEIGRVGDAGDIVAADCDIWIPAARPDVVHEGNVAELRARIVLQGANIPATPGAEQRMHEHGVLCIPDFIANAGGVICASVEYHGGSQSQAFDVIAEKLRMNTLTVLERARDQDAMPRTAAVALAAHRVRTAMRYRR